MSKIAGVIGGMVAVGAAGWLGATWWAGGQIEKEFKAQMANYATSPYAVEVLSYQRSLLGASAVTRIQLDPSAPIGTLEAIQLTHQIEHGPLFFKQGWGYGLARVQTKMDQSGLSAEDKTAIEDVFKQAEPLTALSTFDFEKRLHTVVDVAPWEVRDDEANASLKGAGGQMQLTLAQSQLEPMSINLKALELRSPEATVSVPQIDITIDRDHRFEAGTDAAAQAAQTKLLDAEGIERPVHSKTMMKDISLLPAGETTPSQFDLAFESSVRLANAMEKGDVGGEFKATLSNVRGPMPGAWKSFNLDVAYEGLRLEGLQEVQALQAQMQALEEKLSWDDAALELPEGQRQFEQAIQEMQALSNKLLETVFNRVLVEQKSKLNYALNLEMDTGKIDSQADLSYMGLPQQVVADEILMYTPAQWGSMFSGSLTLNADKSVLPEDMQAFIAYPLSSKAIVEAGDRYQMDLKLQRSQAELNGVVLAFDELAGKFMPQMPALGPDPAQDLGIPADIMQLIEEQGITDDIMQQLEESDDVPRETLELLKQLQQMTAPTQ